MWARSDIRRFRQSLPFAGPAATRPFWTDGGAVFIFPEDWPQVDIRFMILGYPDMEYKEIDFPESFIASLPQL